jgi:hypothetical protein
MNEIITPITEITSKLNDLHAFFIMLLVVVLAAIGIFGYVVIKMILATKDRAEMRNNQIETSIHNSICALNAVEELKIIFEHHIKEHYEHEKGLKAEFNEFKCDLKNNVQELKNVDEKIFDRINELHKTFVSYLTKNH